MEVYICLCQLQIKYLGQVLIYNISTTYIYFELNCDYYRQISDSKDVNSYFWWKSVDKLLINPAQKINNRLQRKLSAYIKASKTILQ